MLALALSVVSVWQLTRSISNWDVVAYTASAISLEGVQDEDLHSRTFDSLKRSTDHATYRGWVEGGHYRRTVATDPSALREQLPFYLTRPLYVGLIHLITLLGAGHLDAIRILGIVPLVLVALITMAWLRRSLDPWPAAFVCLGTIPLLMAVGFLGTPDALALLLGTAAAWRLVVHGRHASCAALLVLAVLARPDMLLVAGALSAWHWLGQATPRGAIHAGLLLALPAATVLVTDRLVNAYSWDVLMYHTFTRPLPWPRTRPESFGLVDYVGVLRRLPGSVSHSMAGGFAVLWAIAVFRGRNVAEASETSMRMLLAVVGASLLLHVVLFPAVWDRFLGTQLLLTAIAATTVLARRLRKAAVADP